MKNQKQEKRSWRNFYRASTLTKCCQFLPFFLFLFLLHDFSYSIGEIERRTTFNTLVSKGWIELPDTYKIWIENQNVLYPKLLFQLEGYKETIAKLSTISKCIKRPTLVGSLPENYKKNLHKSALPFDHTRTLREIEGFYISASNIFTPEQYYIIAQGPTETTLNDFWTTIFEINTPLVVALAMPHGKGTEYADYFEKTRFPMKIGAWDIELSEEHIVATSSLCPNQRLVQRTFQAKKTNEVRIITHLHHENWPDCGPPAPDLFVELLNLLKKTEENTPILVHCSAGQGRSGTLVTTDSILKEARKIPPGIIFHINIPKRIFELRLQRKGLVSSSSQLEAINKAVSKEISN